MTGIKAGAAELGFSLERRAAFEGVREATDGDFGRGNWDMDGIIQDDLLRDKIAASKGRGGVFVASFDVPR